MNDQNLIPNSERTPSERTAIARAGGIASGRVRRMKGKHGRELVRALLDMREADPRIIADMEALGFNIKDITNEVVMHSRQIEKAKRKADTKAYTAVNKAAGYIEETVDITSSDGSLHTPSLIIEKVTPPQE